MNKTVIAPIVSFLLVAVNLFFGIEIPAEVGGQITEYAVTGVALFYVLKGIIENHRKEQPK
ncbi:hypothetical protein ACP26L_36255 (plasmid) [Paenibacillus sp. S-38]|uniref:hypothetical protein n=1 Tax=Paenibacillus sp. S-38 TaxID=3416710 RepID=UPI003CEEA33C